MDIKLNFINRSHDRNNTSVVIFQKNAAPAADKIAVAWRVIRNCGQGDHYPFVYPASYAVGACDSYGDYTPLLPAEPWQLFHMILTKPGNQLAYVGPASSVSQIQVRNDLPQGAISAGIYKGDRLLALKTGIAPMQTAAFEIKPTLWIGTVSDVMEGDIMNSAILSDINTEIPLLGIASADIVMTGGGPGPSAAPFAFNLANVVLA